MHKILIAIIGIIIVGIIIYFAFRTPKKTVAPGITPSTDKVLTDYAMTNIASSTKKTPEKIEQI